MNEELIARHFAIPYHYKYEGEKYNQLVGEFNINFDKQNNKLEDLIGFIEKYIDKRINIHFPQGVDINILTSLSRLFQNIFVRLDVQDMYKVEELKEIGVPFFFDASFGVGNYTHLDSLIQLGVSDIYFVDDLCYNLPDLSEYCHVRNVNLRLILNEIPATNFDKGLNPKSPIYKPDDISILIKYVDSFEFNCGKPYHWNIFEVLYKVWIETQRWHGDLRLINKDLQFELYNDTVLPDFSRSKMTCERRCNRRLSNTCHKCEQFLQLSDVLQSKGIRYNPEEVKIEEL